MTFSADSTKTRQPRFLFWICSACEALRELSISRRTARTPSLTRSTHHCTRGVQRPTGTRSEEHTSELQSRLHLVCRLLLEKKKEQSGISYRYTHALGRTHCASKRTHS